MRYCRPRGHVPYTSRWHAANADESLLVVLSTASSKALDDSAASCLPGTNGAAMPRGQVYRQAADEVNPLTHGFLVF